MEKYIPKKYLYLLTFIFFIGLFVRFINFRQSVYFGYDEARDAFVSQEIFTKGDLKLIGPQASAFPGIHHGPLYYYLIGPLFLLGKGDPYFVSIIFRLINSLGIIGVYILGYLLFGPLVGLFSSFLYAISYEQFIYAIFTGNPSVSNVSWVVLFIGLGIIYKCKNHLKLGLILMLLGASIIPQFDMIVGYSLFVLVIILVLIRDRIKGLKLKELFFIFLIGLSPLYTYVLAELKNKFLATRTIFSLVSGGVSNVSFGDSMSKILLRNSLGLFRNNIIDLNLNDVVILTLFTSILIYLIYKSKKDKKYIFIVIWILSFLFLIIARGFMPFYSYAGVGIGLIVAFSIFLSDVFRFNKYAVVIVLIILTYSNLLKIIDQSSKSLIVEIKAQPGMKLSDEIKLIGKTYEYSEGNAFTIRVTSMPYRIQTVWAYLYRQYGKNIYGYYPYLETGNVLGFPGELPLPKMGTTCFRFLIREPVRGIPENLIIKDINEENNFSYIVTEERIGDFVLQNRFAKNPDCHNNKP